MVQKYIIFFEIPQKKSNFASLKMESLKEKTAKGLLWGGMSNGIQQLLNLLFGIFLARMLSQTDYGMIGMLAIFSAIAADMQAGGFISALNRKETITHQDYNAVFWTSILISIAFYLLFFFSAPLIARFYDVPELEPLARYSFLSFLIVSFSIAPRAILFRNMKVRESAIISITAVLLSGCVGLLMAYNGYAYWGIATQQIVYTAVVASLNFYYAKWRPTLPVDFTPIKQIFGFSSKLVVTNLITEVNNNIFSVLLGRLYTAHDVGNYTQANKWNTMGHSYITNMLYSIAQPVFTKVENDPERQKKVFRKLLRFTALFCFPLMFGLALVAKEFIVLAITAKWLESAYILQTLCIAGAFIPISGLFSNLLISRGHSSTYMWSTLMLCLVQLAAVYFSASYGIGRMVWAYVAVNICWTAVWYTLAHKEIHLSAFEALKDITPYLLLTLALVTAAHLLINPLDNLLLRLTAKMAFVGTTYCLSLWLLRSVIFMEAVEFIFNKFKK